MTKKKFIRVMQRRVASGAVTPSAVRRMGPKGTVRAARKFLARIDLARVAASGNRYGKTLDGLTRRLVHALPSKAQHWGSARKFLNIFLRDAAYNVYLRDHYRLDRIEAALEVPLDSHVAKETARRAKQLHLDRLPRWKTVISVNSAMNEQYQASIRQIAKRDRFNAVHFDIIAWRKSSNYL